MSRFLQLRARARAFWLGAVAVAALALAAGQAVAVGSEVAVVSWVFHNPNDQAVTAVPVGTEIHVRVNVSGIAGTPTGLARIRLYPNATCTNLARSEDATLVNGSVDASTFTFSSNDAGSRSVQVQYLGDATYATSLGACQAISFTKVAPFISLEIHDADHDQVDSVAFTRTVHGAVEVEGPAGHATNWVLFRSWANGTCTGPDYEFTTVNLVDDVADPGLPLGFDAPGTRSYKARYSGDSSYNAVWSECVSVAGTKANPSMTFGIHLTNHDEVTEPVLLGTAIHAYFGLTGNGGLPTGDVTVRMYNDTGCNVLLQTHVHAAGAFVDDSGFAVSMRATPGVIAWQATYEGDSKYKSEVSACVSARWLSQPVVNLAVHNGAHSTVTSVVAGTNVHLRAAVSGEGGTPTGKVNLRRSSSSTCSGSTLLGSGNLSGGVLHDGSIDFKPTSAGSYYFRAIYKGDESYAESSSSCIKLTVTAAPSPTPTPTPAPTAKPTATPTETPDATAEPVATDQPVASAEPSAAPSPAPSSEPTAAPEVTAAATDAGPGGTAAPPASVAPGSTPAPAPGETAGGEGLPGWLLLVVVLVVIVAAVGFWIGGRRRRPA